MRIDILTLFPTMFGPVLGESIVKRAQEKGAVAITVHDLRDWTSDRHRSADDKPFGGGPGMVMKIEPVYRALKELGVLHRKSGRRTTDDGRRRKIYLSARSGKPKGRPGRKKFITPVFTRIRNTLAWSFLKAVPIIALTVWCLLSGGACVIAHLAEF